MHIARTLVALSTIALLSSSSIAKAQVESTGPRLTKQPREGITFRGCFAAGFTKQGEDADDAFYDAISKQPKFPEGNIITALTQTGSWQMWNMEVLPRHAEDKPKKQQKGASRPEVRQCLANAREQSWPGDQFLFLYNGHGMPGGGLAIGPHDDPENKGGTITRSDLNAWLSGFRKGVSITVILLSCYGYDAWESPRPPDIVGLKDVKFKDENGKNTVDAAPYLALITSATPGRKGGLAFSGDIFRLIDALKLTTDHQCPHPERGCGRFMADTDKNHIVTAKEAADAAGYYQPTGVRRCVRCVGTCQADAPGDLQFSYFGPPPHALETSGAGPGSGTIVAEPPDGIHWEIPTGIDCTYQNGVLSEEGCKAIFTGSPVRLRAGATDGSIFGGWSGDIGPDCTADTETCDVVMNADRKVTATFTRKVSLEIAGAGAGSGHVTTDNGGIACTSTAGVVSGTCLAYYDMEATVTLTAAPASTGASTSMFAGWSGACTGIALTCTLPMNGDTNVTANFALKGPVATHRLVVLVAGWPGRVTSSPAGIDCANGNEPVAECEAVFPLDTVVVLTATVGAPGPYQFGGWFGGPCIGSYDPVCPVRITQDEQKASAVIDGWPRLILRFATAGPNGLGSGTVTSAPAGINCTTDGSATFGTCEVAFPAGQVLTLTATPTAGSLFGGWVALQTPECDGSTNPVCRFTMPRGDWPNMIVGFYR